MKRPKRSPSRIPDVDEFKLTEQQREFHDFYVDGETKLNAHASALKARYAEGVAKSESFKWIPAAGTTPESARSLRPIAQAIFWTLYRRRMIRDEADKRAAEQMINREVKRQVITREYIESSLMEIVERCMARTAKIVDQYNRDLGERLAAEIVDVMKIPEKDRAGVIVAIADKFRHYASRHHVFRPTQAKEALKLLGLEIGMFQHISKNTPDTPLDAMTPDELLAEEKRLSAQYSKLTTHLQKKGNGHVRPKH